MLPEKLSYVNPKVHSPLVALIVSAIGCEAFLYLIVYHTSSTQLFLNSWTCNSNRLHTDQRNCDCLSIQEESNFDASPAGKYKVGGFPVLSIMGILALVVNLFIAWIFMAGPALGFLSVSNTSSIAFVIGIFVACILVYMVAWGVRKTQKIDLSLSFSEIPPE